MMLCRALCATALAVAGLVAVPAQATPPGNSGRIVFERALRGDQPPSDLFTVNPDGSGETRVFASPRHEMEAAFSPAAPLLAFAREGRRTPPEIYVGDTAAGRVRRLTRHRAYSTAPAFSPDGQRIAYATDKDFRPPRRGPFPGCCPAEIYVMSSDGSAKRRLTRDRRDSADPDFSPDGGRILFTESRRIGRNRFAARIAVMNADGSGLRGLTRFGGADEFNPKWMPDGRRIAFEIGWRGHTDIATMTAEGTDMRLLLGSRAFETNPVPSPDGTRIVFTSDRHRPGARHRLNRNSEIYVMNVDGSGIVRLTHNRRVDAFPDWQRLP